MAYVLDTSAVVAVLLEEPGYEGVQELLSKPPRGETGAVLLPFMALMEIEYLLLRRSSRGDAATTMRLISEWPAEIAESTPAWRQRAADVKSRGGLSVADAWIASLALLHDAELVHKDPEFDNVPGLQCRKLK